MQDTEIFKELISRCSGLSELSWDEMLRIFNEALSQISKGEIVKVDGITDFFNQIIATANHLKQITNESHEVLANRSQELEQKVRDLEEKRPRSKVMDFRYPIKLDERIGKIAFPMKR